MSVRLAIRPEQFHVLRLLGLGAIDARRIDRGEAAAFVDAAYLAGYRFDSDPNGNWVRADEAGLSPEAKARVLRRAAGVR